MENVSRMKELISRLNQAAKVYYQGQGEVMSNFEYDKLYDELLALEKETGITMNNSPTIHVGYETISELPKEQHVQPMLSLNKTKEPADLVAWLGNEQGLLSMKLDGLSIILTYENGELVKALTRGNGEIGEVITNNAKTFVNIPGRIQYTGTLIVRGEALIRYSDFEELNKQENVEEILAAENGRILSGKGAARRLYVACESEATGWTAVGVAYTQELLRNQDRIYKTYLWIAALALVFALLFSVQLSASVAEPIRKLTQTMQRVEDGDLHVRCHVSSRTELGQLSDSFNHMIAKTADLMDERLRIEEQKRKSEWKALQAQIQPHFLYNTLDSIIWMSHAGRNEEVVEMTSALAQLLRSSIGDGSDTNTLEKELAHVRSYLTIQKMRYNEKLQYAIDMDPQTGDCLLPKLVLQPLVENAIYHGIKLKQGGGTVRIETLLEEDRLLITVEDDGVGMTQEQLATILEKKEADSESSKLGVYNVNERLQLFFGPDAAMKYYSSPGRRTMVMLVLPIVREKEEETHAEA